MFFAFVACSDVDLTDPTDPVASDPTVPQLVSSTPCDACGGDCVVEALAYGGAPHVTDPIAYADRPPAGGPHDPCWAPWGSYDEPLEDDRFVHNLEHGGIVFLHDCDGCAEIGDVEALAVEKGVWTLTTPYELDGVPFAALAWEVRLLAGCWDESLFSTFWDDHVDQAPESIPSDPPTDCDPG